jgi:hypothetical protein
VTATDDLYRLTADGRRLVGDSFLQNQVSLEHGDAEDHLERVEGVDVDLAGLDEAVADVVDSHERYDTAMDGALAPDVHRCLDVSRRVAGDPGVWHYLTVVRHSEFVRRRWEYSSEAAMREKFLGAGTDLYSNAIHRLWWIAELTHDGGDYDLTRAVFDNQTMVNKVFDRWFARYRPGVVVCCDELRDEPSRVIDEVTNQFNRALTTLQLEGMAEEDLRRVVRGLVRDARESERVNRY